jgi:alpha-L-rhamnosidase
MLKSLLIVQVAVILLFSGCSESKSRLSLNDLRCENLSEPLGIGTTTPRLSWKISSEKNGVSQTACQILVASNINLLNEKSADLWNSGKTISSGNVLVPYGGKKLISKTACYWKVRIWDENDKISEWSEVSQFSIGLLTRSDWKAEYIGLSNNGDMLISPQIRKTFDLKSKGEKVFLHVNSLGYHEVYINGEKAGNNVLTPAVSQFNKRSLVLTYDISQLIKPGINDIILWIGNGWYSKGLPGVSDDGPLVKAQIERYENNSWNTIISTDSSWVARNSGYSNTGTWKPGRFGGERVIGSLVLPDMTKTSLDNTTWNPVFVANIPDHELTPQMTESNSITEKIKPVSITSQEDNVWIIDMGKTLTGWFEILFPLLQAENEIIMEYCDHLDTNGLFVNQSQKDSYLATGEGKESFRNKFNYHGFRYIKISNLATEPKKEDISAFLIHTDFSPASSFECSDTDLNNIHDMIFYTFRCLSLGGYLVDCPQLERLGYGGDGNASTETAQTMFDMAPLYANWLQAWADCIREDGGMPHTAPNPYPAGGGPYWCGFIITASWKTYINFGDISFLEKYYPEMQQWLSYVEKYSPDVLLEPWPETDYRGWYLGDWASPDGIDQTNPASISLVNNCFISVCYETMEKIAGVLGKEDDIDKYANKKERIRERVHQELFDKTTNSYGSGSQIDLTYPLLANIVPDSLIAKVKSKLNYEIVNNHDGHIACGLVGIPVFTEWVTKTHEADLMYSMLKKKDYPGYLYMIDKGATTTWEHWNGNRSRIHNCYNGIGSWFYQAVGGIIADENSPGYQHLAIDIQIPDGVTWANTSKVTPYGKVSTKWKLDNDVFTLDILVPANSTAKVLIPEGVRNYQLNGEKITSDNSFVEIESGEYQFIWNLTL